MGVVRAPFQTVEEIYRLVWAAVANKQPIEAAYQGRLRLILSTPAGPESGWTASRSVLPVRWRQPERIPTSWFSGKLALYCSGKAQQSKADARMPGAQRRIIGVRPRA